MMYEIRKNNRRSVRRLFESYDLARSYLRKMLRKRDVAAAYSNPPFTAMGYSIRWTD